MLKPTSVPIPNVAKPAAIEIPTPTVVTAVPTAPAVPKAIAVPEAAPPTPLVTFKSLLAVFALLQQNCSALEQFVATSRHFF